MPNYASVNNFIQKRLCSRTARMLDAWAPQLRSHGCQDRASDWFGLGTIRSVLSWNLMRAVAGTKNNTSWLVLVDHAYPESPLDNGDGPRIDIWVQGRKPAEKIAINICHDFSLESAQKKYQALATVHPRMFEMGYLIFCADRLKIPDWQEEIETNPHDRIMALGIGRHDGNFGRRSGALE